METENKTKLNFYEEVNRIQSSIYVKKGRTVENNQGKRMYVYRNCDDILSAFRSLKSNLILLIKDDIIQVGDRFYVRATAKLTDGTESLEASAYARESLEADRMSVAQHSGSISSYARKYALSALFALDDEKDPDALDAENNSSKQESKKTEQTITPVSNNSPKAKYQAQGVRNKNDGQTLKDAGFKTYPVKDDSGEIKSWVTEKYGSIEEFPVIAGVTYKKV